MSSDTITTPSCSTRCFSCQRSSYSAQEPAEQLLDVPMVTGDLEFVVVANPVLIGFDGYLISKAESIEIESMLSALRIGRLYRRKVRMLKVYVCVGRHVLIEAFEAKRPVLRAFGLCENH